MSLSEELGMIDGKPTKLPEVLEPYLADLDDIEDKVRIKGKTLEQANKENPTWQLYFDARRAELYKLVKFFEMQVERVQGKLFRSYTETFKRDITDNAKMKYIMNEPAYLRMKEYLLEVKELYDKYEAVVNAYQVRGYAINNLTKLRVANIEDSII